MAGSVRIGVIAFAAALAGTLAALLAWDQTEEFRQKRKAALALERAAADAVLPQNRQRDAVRRVLFDPDSASFRDERASRGKPEWWCGEVNAKNRMGGMVGHKRYVVKLHEAIELREFDEAHLDPSNLDTDGSSKDAKKAEFLGYWNGYCA